MDSSDEWNSTRELWPSGAAVDAETATLVSLLSSLVILISGAVAVVCLIAYMRRSETFQNNNNNALTCAKCGASLTAEVSQTSGPVDTGLYAISGAVAPDDAKHSDALLICGQISSDSRAVGYALSANICRTGLPSTQSMCSSNQTNEELVRVFTRDMACRPDVVSPYITCRPDVVSPSFESLSSDTPTDPGIREFTESPPLANERRQGVVQHITPDSRAFGALPRTRSRRPTWKMCSAADTIKISEFVGLSDVSDDDSRLDERPPLPKSRRPTIPQIIDC
ncbi:uncharacterized protein LOC128965719 [Oppia nitens]|uniref:uncharacterized protein LOC128965719 n=1 Tax=Oppia nitens TaxID=1686743 RepID=UPI0023DBF313|nr:uncharacterized protein LOC128965719 [Oppia nitens]